MKDFKKLREEALRQQQRQKEVFKKGDVVMSSRTGDKGYIHRIGGNYAIVTVSYTHSPSPRDQRGSRMPSSA